MWKKGVAVAAMMTAVPINYLLQKVFVRVVVVLAWRGVLQTIARLFHLLVEDVQVDILFAVKAMLTVLV
jgi:hypothetical protein